MVPVFPHRYLEMLLEYLQDYTDRVKPLLDQNELYGKVLGEFDNKWENGTFPGWPVRIWFSSSRELAHCTGGNIVLIRFYVMFFPWTIERDEQCFDACWRSFGPLCLLLLGGEKSV